MHKKEISKYLFDKKDYYSNIRTFSYKWTVMKPSLDIAGSRPSAMQCSLIYLNVCKRFDKEDNVANI